MTHLLDAAGRRITPQQTSEFRRGKPPRNKGRLYPADPPTVEEIVAVMRQAGDGIYGLRMRGLIVVLWRSGMRIHEALLLHEPDLNRNDGSILVRRGKGGKRRIVGMDDWAWEQLQPWLEVRLTLPVGPLFCVVRGPTAGRPWSASSARGKMRDLAARAGIRRRFACLARPRTPRRRPRSPAGRPRRLRPRRALSPRPRSCCRCDGRLGHKAAAA
jgi:integrase